MGKSKKLGMVIMSLVIVFILGCAGIAGTMGYLALDKYKDQISEKDLEIDSLATALVNIGELQQCFVLKDNVRAGTQITLENIGQLFEIVNVPVKIGLNTLTSQDEILGRYFRTSMKDGTVMTKDDIVESQVENSWRYFDVVLDDIPIGLQEGDYVDIRILFPYGEDFIAISHKRVEELYGNVPKMILNENEIFTYNSLLFDKIMYASTRIYAVKYVDPGAQTIAETYYPLNTHIATVSDLDPNILDMVKQEMMLKREMMDTTMGGGIVGEKDEQYYNQLLQKIEQSRQMISTSLAQSQQAFNQRIQEEKANQGAVEGGGGGVGRVEDNPPGYYTN